MRSGDFEIRKIDGSSCAVVQYKGEERDVVIPASFGKYRTTQIGPGFMRKGHAIDTMAIPACVEEVDEALYPTLKTLSAIHVEKGSRSFRSEDGVLYDSSMYSLLFYPPMRRGDEYAAPKKLGRVASTAFSAGCRLSRIVLSSKLSEFLVQPSCCPELEEFAASGDAEDNEGVLISGRRLLFYPPKRDGRTYSIPEGIEEIAALSSQPFFPVQLKTIYAPSTIKRGLENALGNAESVDVERRNAQYRSIDGVLFSWKRELLAYPGRRREGIFLTPAGTERIGSGAFRSSLLETLVIDSGVCSIGDAAFEDSSISTLVIPQSVADISIRAFYGARKLRKVIVRKGSVAELMLRSEGKDDLIAISSSLF